MIEASNTQPVPLILTMPDAQIVKATTPGLMSAKHTIFFETSREDVEDREGEDIACDALWGSRKLFLAQGLFDLNHFGFLGNPYGTGAKPEYFVGRPSDVKKHGKSVWVKGELFSSQTPPPPGSNGDWANWMWHSITELEPRMNWFPSVFGTIKPGGVKTKKLNGRLIKWITDLEWFAVGFAARAQHPELPAISATPFGVFAKAQENYWQPGTARTSGALVMPMGTFAKALTVGTPVTDSAAKTGVQALSRESLEGNLRADLGGKKPYALTAKAVLKRVLLGDCPAKLASISGCFEEQGCDKATARGYASRLLQEVALKQRPRK